jgi:DNA replication protein DnaC
VIDDLGYVKKSEAETSVLFELIAHRYERKSGYQLKPGQVDCARDWAVVTKTTV